MAAPTEYPENLQYPPQQQDLYPPQQLHQKPIGYTSLQGKYPPQQLPPQQPSNASYNTANIVTNQPTKVAAIPVIFHENPVSMQCPSCHAEITTSVHYHVGTFSWLLCLLLFFFICWLCMFIPFCVDSCKDAIHYCPCCSVQLGTYRRM